MKEQSLSNLFFKTLTQVICVLVIINVVNLIIELIRLESFDNYTLTYLHGYFILNGNQVGLNIFSNLTALIVLVMIIMLYRANRRKNRDS